MLRSFFDGPSDSTGPQEARSRLRLDLNDDPPTDTYQEEIVTDIRLEKIHPTDIDPEEAPLTYTGPEEFSPIFTGPEGIPLADIDPEDVPSIYIVGPEGIPLRDVDQDDARSTHIEIDDLAPGEVPFIDID